MSERVEAAVGLFDEGFNCSQAVMGAYCEMFGVSRVDGLRVSAGFGGGIGCTGRVCGALTGACMVLGLKYGAIDSADKEAKERTYKIVARACEMFGERAGSVECRDLLGFDMSTDEGKEAKKAEGAFDKCGGFVRCGAEVLEEILGRG